MKVVVIGGTGLIGSKLVAKLRAHGHEAVAASPDSGVNTLTGEGLAQVLSGAAVVVDVSNSPSFEEQVAKPFFETSTRNLLAAEGAAGVKHHVALSVVGTDRLQESGYFRAKLAQENLIERGQIPYSIVRATQFFEFGKALADLSMQGDSVHVPSILIQPMAADDVAATVGVIAVGAPINGMVEVAGPAEMRMEAFVRRALEAKQDIRKVVADPLAVYSGVHVSERTLLPEPGGRRAQTTFEQWLAANAAVHAA
jgi:uncharacterized protein YbjT (DUF2867 family)